jgi:formamidopyrimidine-DNA glycosylase
MSGIMRVVMPELPEVETIRLGLQHYLVGRKIVSVDVRMPKIFIGNTQNVVGTVVHDVRRFGKGLVVDLENGYSMAVHVKMTGQLVYKEVKETKEPEETNIFPKHTHVVFKLDVIPSVAEESSQQSSSGEKIPPLTTVGRDDNSHAYLYYNDVRQFGWIKVLKTEEVADLPFFKSLGREPLKDLTLNLFKSILKKNKTPIKSLLMDQQKIAGIGNIYACDTLYFAKIHPTRSASSLTDQEVALLFAAIEEILRKSISVGGASANNYVNALGEKGTYQNHFLVYKKEGEPCMYCSEPIKRIKTAGRSTFFCSSCQVQ